MQMSLQELKAIHAISYILGGDEHLLQLFYHQQGPYLRYSKSELLKLAKQISDDVHISFTAAMNLLELEIDPKLSELLSLSDEAFLNLVRGLLYYKEIDWEQVCLS